MASAVNIWDVSGTSPAGYSGGNPNFGDMARTNDGNLWMFTGTDNRNPAHWQIIATQSTGGEGFEQGVDITDEGTGVVNNAKKINFVGANVTATSGTTSEAIVTITSGGGGEVNTASNVGSGSGVFKQKSGVDLQFKSISGATGILVSSTTNEVVITSKTSGVTVCGKYFIVTDIGGNMYGAEAQRFMHAPNLTLLNGLAVNIPSPFGTVTLSVSDFLATPVDGGFAPYEYAISKDNITYTAFNLDPTVPTLTWNCSELGQREVHVRVKGYDCMENYTQTFIMIQDNNNNC